MSFIEWAIDLTYIMLKCSTEDFTVYQNPHKITTGHKNIAQQQEPINSKPFNRPNNAQSTQAKIDSV